jgi:hypothetical protein
MKMKRRALVLVDETAQHPFRQSLPPHVRKGAAKLSRKWSWPRIELNDWKSFFGAYCAAFIVVSLFIA